ncbi:MAG: Ig-like domain-containing protein [Longimicrobiaceae bacterium]
MTKQIFPRSGRVAAALLAAVLVAPACDSPSDPGRRDPAAIAVVSGNNQSGAAGQELANPVAVKVTDSRGRPVSGQAVTFHVTAGGGHVFSGSATTDANGIAQERWTVGTVAGSVQTLEARVVNGSGAALTATATATVTAGAPAQLVRVNASATLAGVVNSVVADTPAVRVLDALGNGVPGVTVTWAVAAGSGTTTAATSVTDANGVAKMAWTLGPASSGLQSLTASIPGVPAVGFGARAGSDLKALSPNGATVSAGVPITAYVALSDAIGPVSGVRVQWTASSGGTVTPATSLTGSGGEGIATTMWTPGPAAGPQTLTATAGTLTATFTVNVIAAGTRTLVVTVPGQVLDVAVDRVLYMEAQASGPRLVRIRTPGTGADVVVKADSGSFTTGYLYSAGAIVGGDDGWFEYRNGTLTSLGPVLKPDGPPAAVSVEGEWAAWSTGTQVLRRNLTTGTNSLVANTGALTVEVGADGDVVYGTGSGFFLDQGGTTTPITTQGGGYVSQIQTDGVNVAYINYIAFSESAALYLDNGNSDVPLAGHSAKTGGVVYHRLNNGWIAWSTPLVPTSRRTPAGTVQQVSPETTATILEALGPDGTVIYRYPTPEGRYFLVTPGGTRYDLGPYVSGARVLSRGNVFFLVAGGSVYLLGT